MRKIMLSISIAILLFLVPCIAAAPVPPATEGNIVFDGGTNLSNVDGYVYAIDAADVDNDGSTDIIFGSGNNLLAAQDDDGDGTWTTDTLDTMELEVHDIEIANLDADDDLEFVSADGWGTLDTLMMWDMNGGWSPTQIHSYSTNGVKLYDIDGDGDLDILSLPNPEGTAIYMYENDGGSFSLVDSSIWPGFTLFDLDAADFNNDSYFDIVTVGFNGVTLYQYNGESWSSTIINNDIIAYDLVIADINGDGDQDIVVGTADGDVIVYYYDSAGGTFTPETVTTLAAGVWNVDVADFDLDGDMDILAGDYSGPVATSIHVLENTAAGWADNTIDDVAVIGLRAYDVDNDGDKDIIAGVITVGGDPPIGYLALYLNDVTHLTVNVTAIPDSTNTDPVLEATTNLNATCEYREQGGVYANMGTTGTTSHSQQLNGLEVGQHSYEIRCTRGTQVLTSLVTFNIVDLEVGVTEIGTTNDTSPVLEATTNVNADCQYREEGGTLAAMATTGTTTHSQQLADLSYGDHTYEIICDDGFSTAGRNTTFTIFRIPPVATFSQVINTTANTSLEVNASAGGYNVIVYITTLTGETGVFTAAYFNLNPSEFGFGMPNLGMFVNFNLADNILNNMASAYMIFYYTDSQVAEIDENTLRIYYFNTATGGWEPYTPPNGGVNTTGNYVWANSTHMSLFGGGGTAPEVVVVDNNDKSRGGGGPPPVITRSYYEEEGNQETGEEETGGEAGSAEQEETPAAGAGELEEEPPLGDVTGAVTGAGNGAPAWLLPLIIILIILVLIVVILNYTLWKKK